MMTKKKNSLYLLRFSGLCVAFAVFGSVLGFGAKISLSVLVGGVMGLANLWLWQGLVAGMIAQAAGEEIPMPALLMRMLVKLGFLAAFIVLALWSGLSLVGLGVGFGSALIGLLWTSFVGSPTQEEDT